MPDSNHGKVSDTAMQIAEAYAIIYPERPARTKVVGWINRARSAKGDKGLKPDQIRSAIDELVSARLLMPAVEASRGVPAQGPGAVLGTITRFCLAAHARGASRTLLEQFLNEYRFNHYRSTTGQQLRQALIGGSIKNIEAESIDDNDLLWLTEPRAQPLLQRLPDPLRQSACRAGLNYLIDTFQPTTVFEKTCQSCAPDYAALLESIAISHVLRGDFTKARKLFSDLPPATREQKVPQVGALCIEGIIATLRGDDAVAITHIKAAIEAERSGTRKRKIFPAYLSFALSLLSLVRDGTTESKTLLNELRSMKKSSPMATQFECLFELAENAHRPDIRAQPIDIHGFGLFALLMAIASRWNEAYHAPAHRSHYMMLQRLFENASQNGYAWAAAEALTVLEATGMTTSLKPAYIENDGTAQHQALDTVSLTNLVQPVELWEYSIRELERLAPRKTNSEVNAEDSARKRKNIARLVWIVDTQDHGYLQLEPREQRMNKSGNWGKGKPVALKRLHEKYAEIDFLIDQDKAAAQAIDKHTSYNWHNRSIEYDIGDMALFKLAGHPNIFDSHGNKVAIVERPVTLKIDTQADSLLLAMQPQPRGHSKYLTHWNASEYTIEVSYFSATLLLIHGTMPEQDGLRVPLTARQRLLDLVASFADIVAIQSDTQDENIEQVPGIPEPALQLVFAGEALSVRIVVEPMADSGTFFDAGEGGRVVYVKGPSGTVPVQRELEHERELMQSLIANSHVLTQTFDGRAMVQVRGTEQVLELLDELQQSDIRCLWPENIPYRVSARADTGNMHLTIKSAEQWFSASGELQYNEDDALSLARLMELLSESPESRFIELAKGEFLALSKTLKAQLDALQTYSNTQRKTGDEERLHPLATLALNPLLESATVTADKKWKAWRNKLRAATNACAQLPSTLEADLRPYQLEGYQWLARMGALATGACLADDMGLGKTLQTLAVLLQRAPQGAALVVAPTSVTGNWIQEAQRFAPTLNLHLYGGSSEERKAILANAGPFDLLITSYGLLHNDIDEIALVQWHTAVLDEAQAIKNAGTGRAKSARQLNADFRIAATGTPIQNNLMDLHSIFGFLNPGLLGSEAKFRSTFALPIERDGDDATREQLRALVSPFILRRNKRDVLTDLPPRTDITLNVELSPEEATLYEALRLSALDQLEKSANSDKPGEQKLRILAELMRLRRLCCNPQLIESKWNGPMSKLALFSDTLTELLANHHKVLVFSQFVDHLKIIERHLKHEKIAYQYLDGSTPAKKRSERVAAFQAGVGDVFLISLTAGGTGLNLTAADYVIHMDPWWNPAVEDQASDRAHRIGQQRPVTIYRMVTAGTIEAQIQELHATKRDLADSLLTGTDSSRIDTEELLRMLSEPGL